MDLKTYLITKEKQEMNNRNRPVLIAFDIARIAAAACIALTLYRLFCRMLYSVRVPNYRLYMLTALLCAALIILLSAGKKRFKNKVLAPVLAEERKHDERAYIQRGFLILSNSEGEVRFELSRIHSLESKEGKTSFSYYDPAGGVTHFSCLDYYDPQIAKMLYEKGIR